MTNQIYKANTNNIKKLAVEIIIIICILLLGGYLRFYGLRGTGIKSFDEDQMTLALGSASVMHFKTIILSYDVSYEPPLSFYIPIPFMLIFGRELWVLRLAPILFGMGAIFFTWLFAREYFSRRAGMISALFIAVLPFAVQFSNILVEYSFMPLFSALVLYCYARHLKTGRIRPLYIGAAAAGLALSTKIVFLYFLFAFTCALIASGQFRMMRVSLKQFVNIMLFFAAGALPFIVWAILSPRFLYILFHSGGLDYLNSFDSFKEVVYTRSRMFRQGFPSAVTYSLPVWVLITVAKRKLDRRAVFLAVLSLLISILLLQVVSGVEYCQMLILLPAPLVFAAGLIDIALERLPVIANAAACLAVAALLLFLLRSNFPDDYRLPGIGVNEMAPALERLDMERTAANEFRILLIQAYLHYKSKDYLLPFQRYGMISFECNRFSPCGRDLYIKDPSYPYTFPYASIAMFFSYRPGDASTTDLYYRADHASDEHVRRLREAIMEMIFDHGYKYFILDLSSYSDSSRTEINRLALETIYSLSREQKLKIVNETDYSDERRRYRIVELDY